MSLSPHASGNELNQSRVSEIKSTGSHSSGRTSTFSNLFHRKPAEETGADLTASIHDYQITKKISGVEDISFLYLAKHLPTGKIVCLKLTDLHISTDYELIDEVIVRDIN
jgi:hypothetical protein